MDKSFKEYLEESKKQYHFTVKLACNEMTEIMLDQLEKSLAKHDLISASAFVETPIQESPLDFPNVRHSKVFISEITLNYPATTELIRNRLSQALNVSEQQIAIYSENDPRKANTEQYLDFMTNKNKEDYVPYVGRDYESDPKQEVPAYGDEHNTSFIKELMDSRKEPNYVYNNLSQKQVIDHTNLDSQEAFAEPKAEKTLFGRTKKAEIK